MHYKNKLKHITQSTTLVKVPKDAQGFLANEISHNLEGDSLFIAKNDSEMDLIQKQIQFFNPDCNILTFPAWDCLPYDSTSPKPAILSNRIKTLYRLTNRKEGQKFFIITSLNAIIQKTIAPSNINNLGLYLEVGTKTSLSQISQFLSNKGYEREVCANNVGEFAVRGGLIDIVMQQAADLIGYRIDFFGDEIESIKIFDPITQITQEKVKFLEILPTSEVLMNKQNIEIFRQKYRQNFGAAIDDQLYSAISEMRTYIGMEHWLPLFYEEKLVSILNYLQKPLIFFDHELSNQAQSRQDLTDEYYQARLAEKNLKNSTIYNPIKPEELYFSAAELENIIKNQIAIKFNQFDLENKEERLIDLEIKAVPDFALAGRANKKDPLELMQQFNSSLNHKNVTIACLNQSFKDRLAKMLPEFNMKVNLAILPLNFGFYSSDFTIIGQQAIFGEKIIRKKTSKATSQRLIEEGLSINISDLVVHRDHGIGKFDGIHTIGAAGVKSDMIKILYGGNDTLFVPVEDINLITRYGSENPLIQLDRLGVAAWKNRKAKVKKRIKVAAEALLKIAAARHLRKSPIFVPEQNFYDEFRARFGFVETDDQMRAIEEVEQDLAKGSPMDRLICGDVGFGKTEVALRAAAIVAGTPNNNKKAQIAIIAPTTLLVRQHYKNFKERFAQTNIKVAQLSRLVSSNVAKEIRQNLSLGTIDIVVGTHALLQKNIKFNNLALVIIDEEQHFGVAQKERLKELRNEVHILNLSATPIPRTLQMSLTGVKDLSLIATPPLDRLAVRNFVMPYDSTIVREAVMREYNRGGKVFFVVPRIRDIEQIEPRLKILLPEIKITHAHGQMSPGKLDDIMNDFVDGKIDMLLSTTIIESGIDISDANTIIIYKSEMFGLSQLYQLRGRVGRSKVRAYAYFMLDSKKKIAKESRKKLEVMQNLDSLGVGFTVASHDMDIRGSGNLLGDEQSGHIKETGVELYQQMLLETIDKLKNSPNHKINDSEISDDDFAVQIKLAMSLLIPQDYMADLSLRMSFYKKISTIKNDEEQDALINEMTDRFGTLPEEITNLLEVTKLKYECKKIGIATMEIAKEGIVIAFRNNKFGSPDELLQMIFNSNNQIRIRDGQKLLFICNISSKESKIASAHQIISKLQNLLK